MTQASERGFWAFLRRIGRACNTLRLVLLNLVFFGFLLLLGLVAGGGVLSYRQAHAVLPHSVLVLKLKGRLVEQYSSSPFARLADSFNKDEPRQIQLRDLVAVIDAAAKDSRIDRIVLLPGQVSSAGFASLAQVGSALSRFRHSGKQVWAWSADYDQRAYLLAAHADRVWLDPMGGVSLDGLSNYRLYYKNALDKLGVTVHLFRVGQFKSAAEPFVLDHASPAAKTADSAWTNDLWQSYLQQVAALRGLDATHLREQAKDLPQQVVAAQGDLAKLALQWHLVDGIATEDQLIQRLRAQGVPPGWHGQGVRAVSFTHYLADLSLRRASRDAVAVVVATGPIVAGKPPAGSIGGESTAALIRKVRKNKRVKALVLRVNSPGGEVYAAEQIRREVALTRAAGIPVVVSMGDVAASGGYWISMNAQRIFAEPTTITGSIGVFGMLYSVPQGLAKLGISSDGVSTGDLAGRFDVTRPLAPETGAMVQSIISKTYANFVTQVAQARHRSYAQIDAVAQGRVWSGRQALQLGLIDQLGGEHAAIAYAAKEAHLSKGYAVRYMDTPIDWWQRILLNAGGSASWAMSQAGLKLPWSGWIGRMVEVHPELSLFEQAAAGRPNAYAYCFCTPES